MCSIMGYCSSGVAFDIFKKGFDDAMNIKTGTDIIEIERVTDERLLSLTGLYHVSRQAWT